MTVTAKNTRVQYTGNGLVATYAYDWKILDQGDLVVTTTDLLGADTTLVLGVGYTVTGAGNDSGGNVVLTNSLATGHLLTVYMDMDIDQPTDLTNQQSPFLERIESALDRQALVSQQLAEKLGRCIQLKPTSTDSSDGLQELLESADTNATVAAASAATATTQAGLANTARIAAEAAVASVPTTFGAFGLTLAETTTASNARSELELGSAALLASSAVAQLGAVCAYTRQQYAVPVVLVDQAGAIALDADLHQDIDITATGDVTFGAPDNAVRGKTIFMTLYAASALAITWDAAFKPNVDNALDATFAAGKRIFLNFRCVDGTNWLLMGRTEEV